MAGVEFSVEVGFVSLKDWNSDRFVIDAGDEKLSPSLVKDESDVKEDWDEKVGLTVDASNDSFVVSNEVDDEVVVKVSEEGGSTIL